MLKVYTCDSFTGHYPVGTAAVIVAMNERDASAFLNLALMQQGLPSDVQSEQMTEVDISMQQAIILNNGDY